MTPIWIARSEHWPEGAGVPTKVVTKKVPLFDDLPEDAFVAW